MGNKKHESKIIKAECYKCKAIEVIKIRREGKRCNECNGILIPIIENVRE